MNKVTTLFSIIVFIPTILFSQIHEYDVEEVEVVEDTKEIVDVPFAVIETTPIYPGCTGENNRELKKCTSDHISAFVKENFKKKKILKNHDPNTYRTFVSFKISKKGEIQNIRLRAPSEMIEKEAVRVLKKIPTLTPGKQRGKVVGTLYSIAISFKIDESQNFSFL